MARLFTSGFEINEPVSAPGLSPDGQPNSSNALSSTVQVRSGTYALRINPTAATAYRNFTHTGVLGRTYFARFYLFIASAPLADFNIFYMNTVIPSIVLTSSRTLYLKNNAGAVQIGSASSAISLNTWTMVELSWTIGSGSIDSAELRVEGSTIASATAQAWSDSAHGSFRLGDANSGTCDLYFDDFSLNDDQGTVQNSWAGEGRIVLLKPISLNANGGSWTDDAAATTSAALFAAVDNTPPNGIADTTAGGGNHQDRNAAANTSLDMNMTDYTTAGIAATDRIRAIVPIICTAAPVVTGAKTGSVGVVSNPTIANIAFVNGASAAANFWAGAAAGTYPTNWKWEKGTATYDPSVTPGTSPVMRVTITGGTASRVAIVDFMGMYVEYSPKRSLIYDGRRRNLQKMIGR